MTFRHINKSADDKSADFNLWLVIDQGEKKKSRWIKLTGLWATKDGEGLAGQLQPHMIVPPGARLVIMPPKADDAAKGDTPSE